MFKIATKKGLVVGYGSGENVEFLGDHDAVENCATEKIFDVAVKNFSEKVNKVSV